MKFRKKRKKGLSVVNGVENKKDWGFKGGRFFGFGFNVLNGE